MTQNLEGDKKVTAFSSGAFRGANIGHEKGLAVVWAVEKWHHYPDTNIFDVYTDHTVALPHGNLTVQNII